MKILRYVLIIAIAAGFSNAAVAETKIAVVDIQKIMRESTAAQSVRSQLESKQKAYQAELKTKEASMQKEEQELTKLRTTLAPDAFEKKVQEFRTKATTIQKDVQKKKAALDHGFEKSLNDIQKVVNEVITSLAQEKSFNIAIPSGQLLFADPSMDITDEVLSRLNTKLPKVSVSFN